MEKRILKALEKVIDPELRLNIVDMGLIYDVRFKDGNVVILMTLTNPVCPYGSALKNAAMSAVKKVSGVKHVVIKITFTPPWGTERISKEIRWLFGF